MIALMGEGPTGPLIEENRKLKKALRRILRAASELEAERLVPSQLCSVRAAEKAHNKALEQARKLLK